MIEITEKEYSEYQALKKVWIHLNAQKSGAFFICGNTEPRDEFGLPKQILVCPSVGADGFAIYTMTSEYSAPGY